MSFYINTFFAAVHFAMNSFLAAAQSNFAGAGAAAEWHSLSPSGDTILIYTSVQMMTCKQVLLRRPELTM